MSEQSTYTPEHPMSLDDAIRLASEVIQEFGPDHIYNGTIGCFYVPVGHPDFPAGYVGPGEGHESMTQSGCLVGEVMKRAGLLTPELGNACGSIGSYMRNYAGPAGQNATSDAISFLDDLQLRQDQGWTWGEALEEARHGFIS